MMINHYCNSQLSIYEFSQSVRRARELHATADPRGRSDSLRPGSPFGAVRPEPCGGAGEARRDRPAPRRAGARRRGLPPRAPREAGEAAGGKARCPVPRPGMPLPRDQPPRCHARRDHGPRRKPDRLQLAQARTAVKAAHERGSVALEASVAISVDGIIDPHGTRTVLGICLSVLRSTPVEGADGYRVFRL
jgi:hypothetical protein